MTLFCPDCRGPLDTSGGKVARCATHGGEYEILYLRDVVAAPPAAMAPPPATTADAGAPSAESGVAAASVGSRTTVMGGMHCVQHPAVAATAQCSSCGAFMCATCDFVLPGDIHLCPSCATKPVTKLSSKRRNAMIWSYVCAATATLGFVGTMIAAVNLARSHSAANQQALGMAMMVVVFMPAAVGIGVGLGAIDRRLVNPLALWIATIWNGVILAAFLLLCIVGTMR